MRFESWAVEDANVTQTGHSSLGFADSVVFHPSISTDIRNSSVPSRVQTRSANTLVPSAPLRMRQGSANPAIMSRERINRLAGSRKMRRHAIARERREEIFGSYQKGDKQ